MTDSSSLGLAMADLHDRKQLRLLLAHHHAITTVALWCASTRSVPTTSLRRIGTLPNRIQSDLLQALEALKRDSLRAFSVLAARIVDDGSLPRNDVTEEALEHGLARLSRISQTALNQQDSFSQSHTPLRVSQTNLPHSVSMHIKKSQPLLESPYAFLAMSGPEDELPAKVASPPVSASIANLATVADRHGRRESIGEKAANLINRVRRLSLSTQSPLMTPPSAGTPNPGGRQRRASRIGSSGRLLDLFHKESSTSHIQQPASRQSSLHLRIRHGMPEKEAESGSSDPISPVSAHSPLRSPILGSDDSVNDSSVVQEPLPEGYDPFAPPPESTTSAPPSLLLGKSASPTSDCLPSAVSAASASSAPPALMFSGSTSVTAGLAAMAARPEQPSAGTTSHTDLMSDYTLAILLGALCKALYTFLESEPATADGDTPNSVSPATVDAIAFASTTNDSLVEHIGGAAPVSETSLPSPAGSSAALLSPSATADQPSPASSSNASAADSRRLHRIADRGSNIQAMAESSDTESLSDARKQMWEEIQNLIAAIQFLSGLHMRAAQPQINTASVHNGGAVLDGASAGGLNTADTLAALLPAMLQDGHSLSSAATTAITGNATIGITGASLSTVAETSHRSIFVSSEELRHVVGAIDRLLKVSPRLENQSVTLTETKIRDMSTAHLIGMIERLNRGAANFEGQRAANNGKHQTLNVLVERIAQSAKRRMDNQCVELTGNIGRNMDLGKLGGILDRQEKTRFPNQDWVSREQRMIDDLSTLQTKLSANSSVKRMENQRFVLTDQKQMHMFFDKLSSQLERSERRMANQDALSKETVRDTKFSEIDDIMNRMSVGMSSQRASNVNRPSVLRYARAPDSAAM
ncbi:hypothetical protein BC831DRAFT_266487 [Entophlyctis helioformis]|nr:hypothetical protein BC831DRAFT_266487 [Entophlyctis helioformis]